MAQNLVTRRLRPFLSPRFRCIFVTPFRAVASHPTLNPPLSNSDHTHDYERRVEQLRTCKPPSEWYPRLSQSLETPRTSIRSFRQTHDYLKPDETDETTIVSVTGRVKSVRQASSKLFFLDLEETPDHPVQVVCNFGKLDKTPIELARFKEQRRAIRRGDHYAIVGNPHRTSTGELSIQSTAFPTLLAPSLHQIPEQLDDAETRAHLRHVDMLVNPEAIATLRVRHLVEQQLHTFFSTRGFTSVKTPILGADAGGAVARPFQSQATEFPDQPLHLRIAPELWLKRLVVGGLEKVYELGPAFRNEGVDATHNPEFHICEFYQAYATLDDLMSTTEQLLHSMAESAAAEPRLSALDVPSPSQFRAPFQRLDFISTIENQLGHSLPDLAKDDAIEPLKKLFTRHSIPLPANPTLPRLLDALSGHVIEPLTNNRPTFITHHPVALSPLSKHFVCPTTGQRVAARAELFIAGREYANMYEEENSPFVQRANFEAQLRFRQATAAGNADDEAGHAVDEPYLHALEWGLPPTGGWGCGIDRLVMLFAGRDRIADVLAFGTLRNVVGLGKGRVGGKGARSEK